MDEISINRLRVFGINPSNSYFEIMEDLLNLTEHLYNELEIKEKERFRKELKRIQTPTN